MKNHYGQYPEIYSADDTRYTYFHDNGARVTLLAGENGVTQEWIRTLKLEHRKEYNMLRLGRKANAKDAGSLRVISLDSYIDEAGDEGRALEDRRAQVEGKSIAAIERSERRAQIRRALAALTPEQRELLIKVRVKKLPIAQIACDAGVGKTAICNRMKKIDVKLRKFLARG